MEGKLLRDSYLLWIKQQRDNYASATFGCDWTCTETIVDYIFGRTEVTYYEVMEEIVRNPNCDDKMVQILWDNDKQYLYKIRQMSKGSIQENNKFFITITTDKTKATPQSLLKFLYFLRDKCKWVKTMRAVVENHRENGIILHTHIIIETSDDIKYGSKVKDKLYGLKMCSSLISGSNYIDYMNYSSDRHDKYVNGDKRVEKMEYVNLDREWRKKNNIPDLIEKK